MESLLAEVSLLRQEVAALKEVNEQLKAEKIKTASLETQLASVLARLDTLEASN